MKSLMPPKNAVSHFLRKRWIACYLLYDANFHHADHAFQSNECKRLQTMRNELGCDERACSEDALSNAYNRVLLRDVEDFIQTHMKVWKADRLEVELEVARMMVEVFDEKHESFDTVQRDSNSPIA